MYYQDLGNIYMTRQGMLELFANKEIYLYTDNEKS